MKHIEFINELGGVVKVAAICGITKGAVSQWRKNGIPNAQRNFLKTKFPNEYRKVWPELTEKKEK